MRDGVSIGLHQKTKALTLMVSRLKNLSVAGSQMSQVISVISRKLPVLHISIKTTITKVTMVNRLKILSLL